MVMIDTLAQTSNLFLLDDLEDARKLAESDQNALRAVAECIETFVARPHKDLGRAGPVWPFVPVAFERKTLWLAAERCRGARGATSSNIGPKTEILHSSKETMP